MTTSTDPPAARRQAYLETLDSEADQVGELELPVARAANDPAMDVGNAPELLRKARRDVIEH